MVVDALAARLRADPFREKFSAEWSRAGDLLLLKPMTFMNQSGTSVQPAMAFFKVEPSELCVVHDELDLPFGAVRKKVGGGHAGHNGLRSIIQHLSTPEFMRIRVGIGRPPLEWGPKPDVSPFVLAPFTPVEAAELPGIVDKAVDAVLAAC
jgi:PTH1 family peptidyl-tRNA hydrolase